MDGRVGWGKGKDSIEGVDVSVLLIAGLLLLPKLLFVLLANEDVAVDGWKSGGYCE